MPTMVREETEATNAVKVRRIDPRKARDVRAFERVPFDLHAGSRHWVPPLAGEIARALDPRHPYYQHSEAEFFLAERAGRAVGRLAICHHRPFRKVQNNDAAFFNFLETANDPAVTAALFDAASTWAQERGLTRFIGPIDFFHGNGFGVLVEGFDHVTIPGIPYHAPYVKDLLEGAGMVPEFDVLSGTLSGRVQPPPPNIVRVAEHLAAEHGIRVLHAKSKKELRTWIPKVGKLFAATAIPGQINVPLTQTEWEHLVDHFWPVIDPELVKVAVRGDEVVGLMLAYANLAEALQRSGGRLWPFGWFHLWRAIRACRRLVINGLYVLPAYQGSGVNLLLYLDMFKTLCQRPQIGEIEIVQVGEKNARSFGDMARIGVRWNKRHRLYGQSLADRGVTPGAAS